MCGQVHRKEVILTEKRGITGQVSVVERVMQWRVLVALKW